MRHLAEALVLIVFMLCCLVCCGSPDIMDGLIKRANNVECTP